MLLIRQLPFHRPCDMSHKAGIQNDVVCLSDRLQMEVEDDPLGLGLGLGLGSEEISTPAPQSTGGTLKIGEGC